jgi:hypothetical protein
MNPNSGQKLRVDAYIIHFLANDKDFAKAFSAAVKNASNPGDKDNAFQTVLDEVRAEMYKNRRLMAKEGEPGFEQVRVDSYHIANSQDQIRKLMREQIKPAIEAGKPVTRIVEDFYKTQPNSNLVPPPGNGIAPPMDALASFKAGAFLGHLPPKERNDIMENARSCYNMGNILAHFESVIGPEKHSDGNYKNPNNKEGLNKIRDSCFGEIVVPMIRNAGLHPEAIKPIRDRSKKDVER